MTRIGDDATLKGGVSDHRGQLPAPGGRLRDDADFRRFWWARVYSLSGSVVTLVALPVLVYRLSGSALLTALVSGLEAAPYVVFGIFAGALTDRWNRRTVMIVADSVNALLIASVPLAHLLGVLTVPHLLVVAFAGPAVAVFFDGAEFGALPVLVGRDRVAQANAAVWTAASAAEIVLPSLVGIALAVIHPADLLVVDALSFVASAACVRAIGRVMYDPRRERPALTARLIVTEIRAGLSFLVGHEGVRTMTVIGSIECAAGGGFVALMVVWCDRVLHIGTQGWRFGVVWGSWSVGGLVASAALPHILRRIGPARLVLRALPFSCVFGVLTSLAPVWQLGALGLLAWSGAYTLVVVNQISYRQQVTPEHLQGRVSTTARMLSWGVGWTVGAVVGGVLGGTIGVRPAMVTMASLSAVAVAVAWTSPLRTASPESHVIAAEGSAEGWDPPHV
jgi:Transmembrane secretion effector